MKSSADEYITFYTTTNLTRKAKIFGLYIITKATGLLFFLSESKFDEKFITVAIQYKIFICTPFYVLKKLVPYMLHIPLV